MINKKNNDALKILQECIKEFDQDRIPSINSIINRLYRVAKLINDTDIMTWCEIQQGSYEYLYLLKDYQNLFKDYFLLKNENNDEKIKEINNQIKNLEKTLKKAGLKKHIHFPAIETDARGYSNSIDSGYARVEKLEDILKLYVSNNRRRDELYYNINRQLSFIKNKAYQFIVDLNESLNYKDVKSCFELLKEHIDDKLMDLDDSLADKLLTAFTQVSSKNSEDWSLALTSCRRLFESLADKLYPPRNEPVNDKKVGKEQFINRLAAFLDTTDNTTGDKALSKAHINFLGPWLKTLNDKTNKGVHSTVTQLEATSTVFHSYLILLHLLQSKPKKKLDNLNVYKATIDELEAFLNISRDEAKKVFSELRNNNINCFQQLSSLLNLSDENKTRLEPLLDFTLIK